MKCRKYFNIILIDVAEIFSRFIILLRWRRQHRSLRVYHGHRDCWASVMPFHYVAWVNAEAALAFSVKILRLFGRPAALMLDAGHRQRHASLILSYLGRARSASKSLPSRLMGLRIRSPATPSASYYSRQLTLRISTKLIMFESSKPSVVLLSPS